MRWIAVPIDLQDDVRIMRLARMISSRDANARVTSECVTRCDARCDACFDEKTARKLAVAHVLSLWSQAVKWHETGEMVTWENRDIAYYSGWDGDADLWCEWLLKAGFMEGASAGDHYVLCDREQLCRGDKGRSDAARRAREYRERKKAAVANSQRHVTSRDHHALEERREDKRRGDKSRVKEYMSSSRNSHSTAESLGAGDPVETGKAEASEKPAKKPKTPVPAAAIDEVVQHYRGHHPRSRPGEKERRLIADRMRENGYSAEDLKAAIDGCHLSPFHSGDNQDGRKYQTLGLIMRNGDKVASFIELSLPGGQPNGKMGVEYGRYEPRPREEYPQGEYKL